MPLRTHQITAVSSALSSLAAGNNPLMVMATGTGKTVVGLHIMKDYISKGGKVAFFAHRTHILEQAAMMLDTWFPGEVSYSFEQGRREYNPEDQVMFAMMQTCKGDRLRAFDPKQFGLLVFDEAHHASCKTYRAIAEHFNAPVLGLTATPDRADDRSISVLFNHIPFVYDIRRAQTDGILVPHRVERAEGLDLCLSDVRIDPVTGDFAIGDLSTAIEQVIGPIAHVVAERTSHLRTAIFVPSVRCAQVLCETLVELGIDARAIGSGLTNDRQRDAILAAFRANEFTHLVNVMIATEGFDKTDLECVVMARPTLSRALFIQMIGRVLRTHTYDDGTVKTEGLILEFTANADKHEIVTVAEMEAYDVTRFADRFNRSKGRSPRHAYIDTLLEIGGIEAFRQAIARAELVVRNAEATVRNYYDNRTIAGFLGLDLAEQMFYKMRPLSKTKDLTPAQRWLLGQYNINSNALSRNAAGVIITALLDRDLSTEAKALKDAKFSAILRREMDYAISRDRARLAGQQG